MLNTLMLNIESLKERYRAGYIRDDQLDRFVFLQAITKEQAAEIKATKNE